MVEHTNDRDVFVQGMAKTFESQGYAHELAIVMAESAWAAYLAEKERQAKALARHDAVTKLADAFGGHVFPLLADANWWEKYGISKPEGNFTVAFECTPNGAIDVAIKVKRAGSGGSGKRSTYPHKFKTASGDVLLFKSKSELEEYVDKINPKVAWNAYRGPKWVAEKMGWELLE